MNKNTATATAKRRNISKKNVPQYSIRIPAQFPVAINENKGTDDSDYAKIIVNNIPNDANESELTEIFTIFGEVANVSIPINYETGLARGFALIEFEQSDSVDRAIRESGKTFYKGRTLYTQKFLAGK